MKEHHRRKDIIKRKRKSWGWWCEKWTTPCSQIQFSYDKSVYAKIAKTIIDFENHSDEVHNENDRKTSAELVADYVTGDLMLRVLNENISHEVDDVKNEELVAHKLIFPILRKLCLTISA